MRLWLRRLLAVAACCFTLGTACHAWTRKNNTYDAITTVKTRAFNELTKAAVDLRLDEAKALVQLAFVLLAALWALVIAKKDEARIALGDVPELLMFLCASVLLIHSIWWHTSYVEQAVLVFKTAGATCATLPEMCIPDVFDDMFNHLFEYQRRFLLYGGAGAVITLVSAHILKEQ